MLMGTKQVFFYAYHDLVRRAPSFLETFMVTNGLLHAVQIALKAREG